MGQFSVEKPVLPGSVLSGNQHPFTPLAPSPLISPRDYAALLRSDLVAFIHRAFCDLNRILPSCLRAPHRTHSFPPRRLSFRQDSTPDHQSAATQPQVALCVDCFRRVAVGHNPAIQIIAASYGQDLADKLARDTRTLMEADWYRRSSLRGCRRARR